MNRFLVVCLLCAALPLSLCAGTGYKVTVVVDGEEVSYHVRFGGGMTFNMMTAYDPISGEFVYLNWKYDEEDPAPVAKIWDHVSGRFIPLFKFPGVEQPLPVIPSIRSLQVCPKTRSKDLRIETTWTYD